MAPTLIPDHLSFVLQMSLPVSMHHDPILRTHPRRRRALETTTTLQDRAYRTEAPEVSQAHPRVIKETSHSAHAYNSTMPGRPRTTTVEETLRPAIGSRPCWRSRSRKSSILSRWYVILHAHKDSTNVFCRKWKSMSFLNLTLISSNDYAFIIWTWRLGEYLGSLLLCFEATAFTS
jgi:hypothetical protein